MMNSSISRPKKSKLELATNTLLIYAMMIQAIVCLLAAMYCACWQHIVYYSEYNPKYLDLKDEPLTDLLMNIAIYLGRWVLSLMNFVSISLLVSLEMVKFCQGIFIEWDWMMYDPEKDMSARA